VKEGSAASGIRQLAELSFPFSGASRQYPKGPFSIAGYPQQDEGIMRKEMEGRRKEEGRRAGKELEGRSSMRMQTAERRFTISPHSVTKNTNNGIF
jgi:hypothetical protein